jgi:chromosome segregation ATPase
MPLAADGVSIGSIILGVIGALAGGGGIVAYVKARGDSHKTEAEAGDIVGGTYSKLYDDLLRRVEQTEQAEAQCRQTLHTAQQLLDETRNQLHQAKAAADKAVADVKMARLEVVALQDRLDTVEERQADAESSERLVADLQRTVADVQARLRSIANAQG